MSHAVVLTAFGPPSVLQPGEVEVATPGPGRIRVAVRFAGVGPTDLPIRAGVLKAFPVDVGSVLGFEAAGVVDAVGEGVDDVAPGDPVAVFLPGLGGYAAHVLADFWVAKPDAVSWEDAAALPASGEAAARTLAELELKAGETLLLLGGLGSVGTIATQLAVTRGAQVVAAVRSTDFAAVEKLGAIPVAYGPDLLEQVRSKVTTVDAVLDAAGRGGLEEAITLVGGTARIITLSDHRAGELGVRLSGPDPERIPQALAEAMNALAAGTLTLRPRITVPLDQAADIHAQLEAGTLRSKALLAVR